MGYLTSPQWLYAVLSALSSLLQQFYNLPLTLQRTTKNILIRTNNMVNKGGYGYGKGSKQNVYMDTRHLYQYIKVVLKCMKKQLARGILKISTPLIASKLSLTFIHFGRDLRQLRCIAKSRKNVRRVKQFSKTSCYRLYIDHLHIRVFLKCMKMYYA